MACSHAARNEIPSADHSSHDRFPLRRVAGLLAGRMDPKSAVVPGDARSGGGKVEKEVLAHALTMRLSVILIGFARSCVNQTQPAFGSA